MRRPGVFLKRCAQLKTILAGHQPIRQHHVWTHLLGFGKRIRAVVHFNQAEVIRSQHQGNDLAHRQRIISNQNIFRHVALKQTKNNEYSLSSCIISARVLAKYSTSKSVHPVLFCQFAATFYVTSCF